jgi:hypothetical protein
VGRALAWLAFSAVVSAGCGRVSYDALDRPDALGGLDDDAGGRDAGAPPLPAWREGQPLLEWRVIPGSSLSLAPPSTLVLAGVPSTKIDAWASLSIDADTASVYCAANGSSGGYAGNEVDVIALGDDAPRWVEIRGPTPESEIGTGSTHYRDGRPSAREPYYGQVFSERLGRALLFGGSTYLAGGMTWAVDGFDPITGDWDPAGTYPTIAPSGASTAPAICEDDETGDVYVFVEYAMNRWIAAENRWATIFGPTYGVGSASATDLLRRRILIMGGEASAPYVVDLATSVFTAVTLTGSRAADFASLPALGMIYEPARDQYLVRTAAAGGTVYSIDAATFAVEVLPTIGGAAIPASVTGTYRKFLYAPTLAGVVVYPAYDGEMWFLRTH